MNYQYSLSAKFSHLERYRGFFPSFADDQIDMSTTYSTIMSNDMYVDSSPAEVSESVGDSKHKTKQSGDAFLDEIGCSGGSSSLLSGSSGSSSSTSSSGQGGGTSRRVRKAKTPLRSAWKNDPRFRGITFSVETKPCHEKWQKSQLLIRSFYSMKKKRSGNRAERSKRRRPSLSSSTSSSEPDTGASKTTPRRIASPDKGGVLGGKQCASCLTRHTPLWRDAEDGTPLCNACGIRYKKYRMRCVYCWNIPKKDGTMSNHSCSRCGNALRITLGPPKRSFVC